MDNRVIQSLWIGDSLSNNELLCLNSYIRHGHEFHLYSYNAIRDLPEGVKLADANEIVPLSCFFKDTSNTYASFADWFRLKLLFQKGGWWVDMDTVCVKPLDMPGEYCFSSERSWDLKTTQINNTCIKSPPGALYLEELLQAMEQKLNAGPVHWGEIGVYLFRDSLPRYVDLLQYVRDPVVFCPIDFFDLSGLICEKDYVPAPETFTIHLWNEIWRRGNLDKQSTYHPGSIYEKLKKEYLFT
jgi:hypothetical protein